MAYVPIKIATNVSSAIVEQNGYLLPINTTENWSEHFSTRSWTKPQDQIDAGYQIFIQPAASSGYYEEVYDCESQLGNRQIVIDYAGSTLASAVTITTDISVSTDNVTYTTYSNVSSLIVSGFRYIKVRVNVSSNSTGLYLITDLNAVVNEQFDQDIVPQIYTNLNTFYAHNVTVGGVFVNPLLYENTNTFYEHDVVEGGVVLRPDAYVNESVIYSSQVTRGAIDLAPTIYENNNTFYDIVINTVNTLIASRFDNENTFNVATISLQNTISPSLFENVGVIYNPVVVGEGTEQELTPELFLNESNFYVTTVRATSRDSEFLGTFKKRRRTSLDIYDLPEKPVKSKKRKTLEVLMMG